MGVHSQKATSRPWALALDYAPHTWAFLLAEVLGATALPDLGAVSA